MNENTNTPKTEKKQSDTLWAVSEIIEMVGAVTVIVMLLFALILRISIVDGHSMDKTLAHGEYLAVSNFLYTPERGDIVIIHDISAVPYSEPIVKRVIALGGDTVDIDSLTGTVYVNGEMIDEGEYVFFDENSYPIYPEYSMPITVPENEIFVLGDNRHNSGDSRQIEIGTIDERCVVGRAVARLFPAEKFKIFN